MEDVYKILERLEKELLPAALELAGAVVFYDSLGWILIGLFALAIVVISTRYAVPYAKRADWASPEPDMPGLMTILLGSIAVISGLIALPILFNIWNWVGIFAPKLRFAKIIFDRIMQ